MPKIPFVSSQFQGRNFDAKGPKIEHPWYFNPTGAATARVGEEIQRSATVIDKWSQKIAEARDVSETAKVKTELIKDKMDLLDKFEQRQDFANFIPELKQIHADNQEKYRGMVTNTELWNKLHPQILHDNLSDEVHIRQLVRKKQIDTYRADYFNNVDFIVELAGRADKETAAVLIGELHSMSADAVKAGIVTNLETAKSMEKVKETVDWNRIRNDIQNSSPDDMRFKLYNVKNEYPNLSDNHFYQAVNLLEKKEREVEKELAAQQKERYNEGAKEAFDRWQLWNQGKRGADRTGFETWLEDARTKDIISEKTYESYTRGIERERDKKQNQKIIATLGHWQTYQTVLGGIKDGTYELEDVSKATTDLPKNMRNELMKLASNGRPEDKARAKGMQYLLKKAKENELDADAIQDLKDEYEMRTKESKVPEMMNVAKEMAGNLEDNSLAAQIRRKQEQKGKTPGIFERVANMFGGKASVEDKKQAEQTEEALRKQLADKGVNDKAQQDIWIERYKAAGIIKTGTKKK